LIADFWHGEGIEMIGILLAEVGMEK